jgi:UDP-glucose 4-epimerase
MMSSDGTVCVTGVSGQIGRHLGRHFRSRGYFVTGVDLVEPPAGACDEFHRLDLVQEPAALHDALSSRAHDAVVHLAAVVEPRDKGETDARLLATNVLGTFNLTSAAERAGAPRLVFMSSESVLGFAFSEGNVRLRSVPVDEAHPLCAHDPYGLSKVLGEHIADAYSSATGAPAISLRPPWVWIPEKLDRYLSLTAHPEEWAHGLWAYIVVDDLNELTERALLVEASGHSHFYAAAADNGTSVPTRELLREFYGFEGPFEPGFDGFKSVISSRAAQESFGWQPRWTWREWLPSIRPAMAEAET